ncbi:hypothetical protein Sa4125_38940 [Aureimonas sp. SA4125]|uniref:hypothetical protein n=1 Tax=Aureimonas sp. SA4125 TaxID=2826993 RepID=UPI001CC784DD|nr:hypothetical protein [Aureimonas sp. SA4125]BDA86352.1 hypothetical protein Sa4125_38940 [Aureimonas sp. SA4125]
MEEAIPAFSERYLPMNSLEESNIFDRPDVFPAQATLVPSRAVAANQDRMSSQPSVCGAKAVQMVEQAAELIKEYERKFVAIEADARCFIERVEMQRATLKSHVHSLQISLAESEMRARSLENALQRSNTEIVELQFEIRTLKRGLEHAAKELTQSSSYFQRIQEKLGSI